MNTPITDAAAQTITIDCDDSCVAIYVYESDVIYEGELVPAFVARRLELDRAALMKALKAVLKYSTPTASARIDATRILATARANFPES